MKSWIVGALVLGLGWQIGISTMGAMPPPPPKPVKIAKSMARMKDYDKVKSDAQAKKKPIAIVLSEEGAKKDTMEADTVLAFKRAGMVGVPIFCDLKEIKSLPEKISKVADGASSALPAMIFVNAETEEVIVTVKHNKNRNAEDKDFLNAKKTVAGATPAKEAK